MTVLVGQRDDVITGSIITDLFTGKDVMISDSLTGKDVTTNYSSAET